MRISLELASRFLKEGHVVGVPTETVYGLAASVEAPQAVAAIFSLKGRPPNNPLIIHLACEKQIFKYIESLPDGFNLLAKNFWPGPMTIVIECISARVPEQVRAGLSTAAFRMPSHPSARAILENTGPLVMPSANISGRPSATCADHVEEDFGSDFPVFDGGECSSGLESTILYWCHDQWEIARLGALSPNAFIPVLGYAPNLMRIAKNGQTPLCPGQLHRHYAPQASLILLERFPSDLSGVVIGYSDRSYPQKCHLIALSHSNRPEEAAKCLYAVLRKLDLDGIEVAWVDFDLPDHGLWLTIKERLLKASKRNSSQYPSLKPPFYLNGARL